MVVAMQHECSHVVGTNSRSGNNVRIALKEHLSEMIGPCLNKTGSLSLVKKKLFKRGSNVQCAHVVMLQDAGRRGRPGEGPIISLRIITHTKT